LAWPGPEPRDAVASPIFCKSNSQFEVEIDQIELNQWLLVELDQSCEGAQAFLSSSALFPARPHSPSALIDLATSGEGRGSGMAALGPRRLTVHCARGQAPCVGPSPQPR
jgi:hypothetical protein